MKYLKRVAYIIIFELLKFSLVFADDEDKIVELNISRGILGCRLDCYMHGSCKEISYSADHLNCGFAMSSVSDAENEVRRKLLSGFPCVDNSCGRHEQCLITRGRRQACIDIRRKSQADDKGISKVKSERSVVWVTDYKECVYDYITRQQACIRTKGWSAAAIDPYVGHIFYETEERTKMYRKTILGRKKENEGKGSQLHFHILHGQRIVFVDETSTVHLMTNKFLRQPCRFKFGTTYEFWTAVDQENELLMYAIRRREYMVFKTLDLKTEKLTSTFKVRRKRIFVNFVTSAGNIFFCSPREVSMVETSNRRRSRRISKACDRLFVFQGNVFNLLSNYRDIKKFDSNGEFLEQIKIPNEDGRDVNVVQFTALSLHDLEEVKNN